MALRWIYTCGVWWAEACQDRPDAALVCEPLDLDLQSRAAKLGLGDITPKQKLALVTGPHL